MLSSLWSSLSRLGPFLVPYRAQWALAVIALFAAHVIEVFIPFFLKEAVNRIVADESQVSESICGIFSLTVLRYLILSFGRRRNALISVDLAGSLRLTVYSHLLKQGSDFFSHFTLGDLMARATNDIDAVRQFFRGAIHQLISLVAIAVIAPIFMLQQSIYLTLLLALMLTALVGISWSLANLIRHQSATVQANFAALTDEIRRNLRGIRTIQCHAQEDHEIRHFAKSSNLYAFANLKLVSLQALLNTSMVTTSGLVVLLIIGIGSAQVLKGEMSVGTLTAFIFYLGMIAVVLTNCSYPAFLLLRASAACTRVFQILDEKPEIDDDIETIALPDVQGAITVDKLAFRYPNGTQALVDVSLAISAGELITILGRVGSGKSTLLRLLSRRLKPTAGTIALDGIDLRRVPLPQLRRELAFVAQDPFLFATSLAENISYDKPDRAEDLIWAAARAASLEATIRCLSDGILTPIGESGVTLSGGQKQRINLARSLIRNVPVLLLDDCFSALDAKTERQILRQIKELRHGLTTILVSHRVSTARYADKVYVLDQGRLTKSGNYDVLQKNQGFYADLNRRQDGNSTEVDKEVK